MYLYFRGSTIFLKKQYSRIFVCLTPHLREKRVWKIVEFSCALVFVGSRTDRPWTDVSVDSYQIFDKFSNYGVFWFTQKRIVKWKNGIPLSCTTISGTPCISFSIKGTFWFSRLFFEQIWGIFFGRTIEHYALGFYIHYLWIFGVYELFFKSKNNQTDISYITVKVLKNLCWLLPWFRPFCSSRTQKDFTLASHNLKLDHFQNEWFI